MFTQTRNNTPFSRPRTQRRSTNFHSNETNDDNDNDTTNDVTLPAIDSIDELVRRTIEANATHGMASLLPANFRRLDTGVYQFGTRKVYLRERSGVLVARVGGGFVSFVEYVEKHGAVERERLRRLARQYGDALQSGVSFGFFRLF